MKSLWQISVAATAQTEDALVGILAQLLGQTPSVYTDMETGVITVSIHLEKLPALTPSLRLAMDKAVKAALPQTPPKIQIRKLPPENWAESWKRHFKPLTIGPSLLIKPSWSQRKPRVGQSVVVLDPGLSFGTGQHATTSFCLRCLAQARQAGTRQSFLDIGSGSGILAISAAKLGYSPVEAFDFDPQAVRATRANARDNQVKITARLKDLTKEPLKPARRYDMVCANLIFDILIGQARKICKRVKPDGSLVLAGILTTQFDRVRCAFEAQGMRLAATRVEKEWQSGRFEFAPKNAADARRA